MSIIKKAIVFSFITALSVSQIFAEPDPDFHIYLLFGQSNMAGPCNNQNATAQARDPQDSDCDTTSRIKVLAWGDCNANSYPCGSLTLNRTYDQWYTAFPPFHNCHEGIGPADYFGKTLLDSIREDITIGFVPCALSGQNINVYVKGMYANIDEHTRPTNNGTKISSGAYEWMVKRAKIAQQSGIIKGILLHQGEANSGEGSAWVNKVKNILADLKNDLGLGDIPFIAGELIQDPSPSADQNAKRLNPFVNQLPNEIPNCGVASSDGFKVRIGDSWGLHFACDGIREFGRRYASEFLKLADADFVPRKGPPQVVFPKEKHQKMVNSTEGVVRIYTLDGHVLHTFNKTSAQNAMRSVKTKGVFLVSIKLENGKNLITPFVRE